MDLSYVQTSIVAQLVKNLPTMRETWVWSLGWEDPLKEGKATHSSFLAQKSMGLQRVGHNWATFTFTHYIETTLTKSCYVHMLKMASYHIFIFKMDSCYQMLRSDF